MTATTTSRYFACQSSTCPSYHDETDRPSSLSGPQPELYRGEVLHLECRTWSKAGIAAAGTERLSTAPDQLVEEYYLAVATLAEWPTFSAWLRAKPPCGDELKARCG